MGVSSGPKPWEVWHARFNYSGKSGYKYRPVVIVDVLSDGTLAMMVTCVANELLLPHDYQIKDWESAGLRKPSIARADRLATLPVNYFGTAGKIGRLSERDIVALEAILGAIS